MHTPSEAKQLCVVRVLHSHKLHCLNWTKSSRLGGKVLMSKLMHLCLQSLQVSIFLQYDPLQLSPNTHTVPSSYLPRTYLAHHECYYYYYYYYYYSHSAVCLRS